MGSVIVFSTKTRPRRGRGPVNHEFTGFLFLGMGGGGAEGAPGSFYPDCRACWMPGLLDKKGPHIHEMRGPDNTIWVLDIQTYIL